jgi:hypothetical protein
VLCAGTCGRACKRAGGNLVGDFLEALGHDSDGCGIIRFDECRDAQAARELVSTELRNEVSELAMSVESAKNTTSCIVQLY